MLKHLLRFRKYILKWKMLFFSFHQHLKLSYRLLLPVSNQNHTAFDLADEEILKWLEELKKKQASVSKNNKHNTNQRMLGLN